MIDDEPQPGDERSIEEYLLPRAVLARARSEQHVVDARSKGRAWHRIGESRGTSAQAAQQRDAPLVDAD